jgi:carbonic anhydrase
MMRCAGSAIVRGIAPAAAKAKKEYKGTGKAKLLETAIDDNVKLVEATLTKRSPVLNHLAKAGKIRIIAAKYDLSDFKVTLMQ